MDKPNELNTFYLTQFTHKRNCSQGCQKCKNIIHGECTKLNGGSANPFWRVWQLTKHKVLNKNNPSYRCYGAMGFTIDENWKEYLNFKNDMFDSWKKGLKLITHTKHFCKEDCYRRTFSKT